MGVDTDAGNAVLSLSSQVSASGRPLGLDSCGPRIEDLEPVTHPVWTLVSLKRGVHSLLSPVGWSKGETWALADRVQVPAPQVCVPWGWFFHLSKLPLPHPRLGESGKVTSAHGHGTSIIASLGGEVTV